MSELQMGVIEAQFADIIWQTKLIKFGEPVKVLKRKDYDNEKNRDKSESFFCVFLVYLYYHNVFRHIFDQCIYT